MANILPGARVRLTVGIVVAMLAVCASAVAKVNDDVASPRPWARRST